MVYDFWVFGGSTHPRGWFTRLTVAPFVLAMGRYTALVVAKRGGAPEDLFVKDRVLQLAVLTWLVLYGGGIYAHI